MCIRDRPDGGWRCEKYSFGHGEETQYSTPYTTLVVLDLFRQIPGFEDDLRLNRAVAFLLAHWVIRRPISPCPVSYTHLLGIPCPSQCAGIDLVEAAGKTAK